MKQILQDMASGMTSIVECPTPVLTDNSLRISTNVSLISAGTERMLVDFGKASYLEKARQQPEKVKMVLDKAVTDGILSTFDSVRSKLLQPLPLGYSNVGLVEEVSSDISTFKAGDRVVSNGAHADIVTVKKNLCAHIPDEVDDDSAAFTVVGSIGLQGVRLAQPSIGEAFVVIGVGLIGLLTVQLLKANGCRVLAVDFDNDKLALAEKFGAEICNSAKGEDILSRAALFSRGRGVDGVIITASTKSSVPIKQAAQISRSQGRIILVGVAGLNLDRADFYEKELNVRVSCSYGPGRYDPSYEDKGNDYPIGYVRWTEQRNFEAFLDMMAIGAIDVKPLISSRFDFINAPTAYQNLTSNPSLLGILLDYGSAPKKRLASSIQLHTNHQPAESRSSLGFIGAGNYASRVLIPAFHKAGAKLHTLVTANGINSVIHGKKAGFLNASTDVDAILKDPHINTVVIATQHNSHAKYVIDSLNAGKNVWVEKPLAIDDVGLSSIEATYQKVNARTGQSNMLPQLMVGFNRRFSPQVKKMYELLLTVTSPKSIIVTVNAGFIPKDHWTQDPFKGGGRIIGECCHFIDLIRHLVGKKIVSVNGQSMFSKSTKDTMTDQSSITLGFEDGSFGTILYLSNGATNYPKERVEVFTEGKVLQLDNFRKLKGFGWSGFKKMNLWSQSKGQNECAAAFLEAIKTGIPCIPVSELFEVARVTIQINNMLEKNIQCIKYSP